MDNDPNVTSNALLFCEEFVRVRVTPTQGGVHLTQVVDGVASSAQVYVSDNQLPVLVALLQQRLAQSQQEQATLLDDTANTWRVTGSIRHDDYDGEEHATDVELTVKATDEGEALRLTLAQLQERYVDATWEAFPLIKRRG
ncbi:MAG: hypothetical protein MI924_03015 [Chloroflexales bacterium]|nr:hypothetical protein [Chloroflexales bacterium]